MKVFTIETRQIGTDEWMIVVANAGNTSNIKLVVGLTEPSSLALGFVTREDAQSFIDENCPSDYEARIDESELEEVTHLDALSSGTKH